jgi:DHA2 family multidrug resistance protein
MSRVRIPSLAPISIHNIGGSLGIALVTTMLARDAQVHQAMMVAHTTPYNAVFVQQVAATKAALAAAHSDPVTATMQAYELTYDRVLQQARLWAFVDNFRLFGLLCLACIPVIFLFKRIPYHPRGPVDAH